MSAAVPWPAAARAALPAELLRLMRPRILALVVFTAAPVIAAGRPLPAPAALVLLLAATVLLGASCDAFNAWIERRSDGLMERTRARPLPAGRLHPSAALAFAACTGAASLLAYAALHPAASVAAALVLAHYVVVYSAWLKRRTPWNIVIGGVAGGAAPLLADLALHGRIGLSSWLLLLIVSLWTPAHFWAIALYRKEEYAAAGIPMLPVVAGDAATRRAMVRWAVATLLSSLLPWALGAASAAYAIAAPALGAAYVAAVVRCLRRATRDEDRAAFRASVRYLGLLVLAWTADALLLGAP